MRTPRMRTFVGGLVFMPVSSAFRPHVHFTTADTAGRWSLGRTSFARWGGVASVPQTFLDTTPDRDPRAARRVPPAAVAARLPQTDSSC